MLSANGWNRFLCCGGHKGKIATVSKRTSINSTVNSTIPRKMSHSVAARQSLRFFFHRESPRHTSRNFSSSSSSSSSWVKENPFKFQLAVATAKTSAADLMVQLGPERKSWQDIDWKRNGIFVIFGFAYLGGFQYYLMVNKYRQWFPTMDAFAKLSFAEKLQHRAGLIDAAKMVLFDVTIHLPLMYFPTYYTVKEFVSNPSYNPIDWVSHGVSKYYNNMQEDLTAMIQLWGPSDCVQFVLPIYIRMPFRHMVSFFWTAYVSFTRGKIEEDNTTQ